MGELFASRPIWQVVQEQILNAAFRDPRVSPLDEAQWQRCEMEIEVLSAPHVVVDPASMQIGKHGIILRLGNQSAVFRPGQPQEAGWSVEETLLKLAEKAGIHEEGWREKASFLLFESQIFHGKVDNIIRRAPWQKHG